MIRRVLTIQAEHCVLFSACLAFRTRSSSCTSSSSSGTEVIRGTSDRGGTQSQGLEMKTKHTLETDL